MNVNLTIGSCIGTCRKFCIKALLSLFFIVSQNLMAQLIPLNGLFNSGITSLASDSMALYAGCEETGVFKSLDFGKTWVSCNGGLPTKKISALSAFGTRLLAGTDKGLYYSDNSAKSWTSASFTCTDSCRINAFATLDKIIYVASSEGILQSIDSGKTWVQISKHYDVLSLCVTRDFILGGLSSNGFIRSADKGVNWKEIRPAIKSKGVGRMQSLVAVGSTIYAGTYEEGLLRSVNRGTTWTYDSVMCFPFETETNLGIIVDTSCYLSVNAMCAIGRNIVIIVSNRLVLLLKENAHSLLKTSFRKSYEKITALHEMNNIVFCGTQSGSLYYSEDSGSTWKTRTMGLPLYPINKILIEEDTIYVASKCGVFFSPNNGKKWRELGESPKQCNDVIKIKNVIVVASNDGLFRMDMNTKLWLESGIRSKIIKPVEWLDLIDGNKYGLYADGTAGIYYSTNLAKSWKLIGAGIDSLELPQCNYYRIFSKQKSLFIGSNCFEGAGVYDSKDGGITWEKSNSKLNETGVKDWTCIDSCLLLATETGLYNNCDSLLSTIKIPLLEGWRIANVEANGSSIFVAARSGEYIESIVLLSTDKGLNWRTLISTPNWIRTIFSCKNSLFFGTENSGILTLPNIVNGKNSTEPVIRGGK